MKKSHENSSIGGSGFIGQFAAQQLQQSGHNITIFHRGKTSAPQGTEEILGNRQSLQDHQSEFRRQKFDVVVDFVISSGRQAQQLMDTFRGIAGRVVALSSMDVYRCLGPVLQLGTRRLAGAATDRRLRAQDKPQHLSTRSA